MKTIVENIKASTKDFLTERIGRITDYQEANEILLHVSGIDTFFSNQNEFLFFLETLKPIYKVCEESYRQEYGDFQTPSELSDSVCSYLISDDISPDILIEPTYGKGSFIISALQHFPKLKKVFGVEVYEPYYWQTKFAILELFLTTSILNKPRIYLHLKDIFTFDLKAIAGSIDNDSVLVLGNPPWVTNSELSKLNSDNLPKKSNFKAFNGIDAITGKGNFDIAEYIILMMFGLFSGCNGHLAMLVKNSVIRNLIYDLKRTDYSITDAIALSIDTKKYFNVSVEASLFKCDFKRSGSSFTCKASSLNFPNLIEKEFGWLNNKFVADIDLYEKSAKYEGLSPYVWRQGIKHDCSDVMELKLADGKYVNGFEKELNVEDDIIYGLVKSSDLSTSVIEEPRKYVIITQKHIGEDTSYISEKFPKLYQYLSENKHLFDQRKSIIYNGKPPFSIFGIGNYSFKPYKVAISGLYKNPNFSLVLSYNNKPLMLDDTCYFLGFDDISESIFVWAILNSECVQQFIRSIAFLDAKRPYTKDVLMRIGIGKAAKESDYSRISDLIKALDKSLLAYVDDDKWYDFIESINFIKPLKNKQLLLF